MEAPEKDLRSFEGLYSITNHPFGPKVYSPNKVIVYSPGIFPARTNEVIPEPSPKSGLGPSARRRVIFLQVVGSVDRAVGLLKYSVVLLFCVRFVSDCTVYGLYGVL